MPSSFDNSVNFEYSKPVFDTEEDRIKYQNIREAEYIFERKIPRLPTRQEELDYIDW